MFASNAAQVVDQSKARSGSGGAASSAWRRAWRVGALSGTAVLVALVALALPAGALAHPSFDAATNYKAGQIPSSVAVGEFNGDSDPDLAVTNYWSGTVSVLLGGAGGSFNQPSATPATVGDRPFSVAVGEFNGDSHPDLAVANYGNPGSVDGNVSVLLGEGGGSFKPASTPTLAAGDQPFSVAVGDFDANGKDDLAVANQGSNNVSVLLGNGAGAFNPAPVPTVAAGDGPAAVAVGNFNGDQDPDLAVANQLSDNVSVLLGGTGASFAAAANFAAGDGPIDVAVGHLNREDSRPDLAVANQSSNDVSVLLGNGGGSFSKSSGSPFAAGQMPGSVAVGDFDGLGADLAVTNYISADVSVLSGRASAPIGLGGNFDPATTFAPDGRPVDVEVGDFNGDSEQDLALVNQSSDAVSVLLNQPHNDPPRDSHATNEDIFQTSEDTPLSVPAKGVLSDDVDPEGDALSAVLESGPNHGSVTLNSDGSFVYTPNRNFDEFDTFTYRASDGTAKSDPVTVFILIRAFPDAPVANDDTYTTDEDTPLTIGAAGVLGNDTDDDGDNLTAALASDPAHGSLTLNPDGSGSFTYTPAADFNGTDSFSYRASDGAAADTATVTIDVKPVNDAPAAADDTYATDEDTPLDVSVAAGVLSNDSDVERDALSAAVVSGPAHGSLELGGEGTLSYTPERDFNGSDSFSYRASDGDLVSETVTVTIDVGPVNDAPAAAGDAYETDEDTPLELSAAAGVLSNDSDVEGDAFSAAVASGPAHGSLALNPNGSLSYTPDADYNGTDSFSYRTNDSSLESDPATVTIDVKPINDAPHASGDAYATDEDTPLSVAAAEGVVGNDSDIDGDALAAALVSSARHGSLDLRGDGSLRYTPDRDYNGTDSFRYRADDGDLDSDQVTVTIEVRPMDEPPPADPAQPPPADPAQPPPAGPAQPPAGPASAPAGSAAPAEPVLAQLRLAPRCVRPSRSGRVRIRMSLRMTRPGPLQIRIDRAVGASIPRSCPSANPRHRFTGRFRSIGTLDEPSARPAAAAAAVTRRRTLRLRLSPGLYRISVRAKLDQNRLSAPVRRYLRVLG